MDISNITAALLELQDYDADTFFYTLYQCIDLTPLTNAAAGPGSRGPNLKDIDLSAGLFLWYCWLWVVRSDNPPNPTTLRRELEDPESNLAKLNRVDEGRKLSVRRTLANHFERLGSILTWLLLCCWRSTSGSRLPALTRSLPTRKSQRRNLAVRALTRNLLNWKKRRRQRKRRGNPEDRRNRSPRTGTRRALPITGIVGRRHWANGSSIQ